MKDDEDNWDYVPNFPWIVVIVLIVAVAIMVDMIFY